MSTPLRLPTGTVTFLFTDIEGSTALWGRAPHAMNVALAAHDALFRDVVPAHRGSIFKTVGDAVCAAFARADDAIAAAIDAQRRLAAQTWPDETGPIRVRMGIHTGQAIERDDDYFGPALNRVARIQGIAHGGQVLITRATASVVEGMLDPSIRLRDLGVHHLKGLAEPETALQIVAPGLEVEFPPLTSADQHPNNIPAPISSFVGRTRELAELAELLRFHRLIAIAGPGGIGKTRVSQQLAAGVLDRFPDGAWIVELAPINDPRLVAQAVGDVFALREDPQSSIDSQLLDHLAHKKLLLVLDNSEHVLAETAELAKKLLGHCPDLVIIATTREPLHLTGEFVFRLPPLGLPSGAESDGESVTLFLERARAVRPDLAVSAGDFDIIARICRRVEGIPLAIELAAARAVTLPLAELERRLVERFDLLTSRDTTRDDRHRTLHATIGWSYLLLTEEERTYLRCLAAFEGGFFLDAAAAIGDVSASLALDRTESLVDKSLLIASYAHDRARYECSDMIRAFLRREVSERGETAALCDRHFDYFAAYTQGADDHSATGREAWMARLNVDIANIRAATDWGLNDRHVDLVPMLINLSSYWWTRGYITEGESQLRRFLALPDTSDSLRAPLLRRASTFATIRGDYRAAHALTQQARDAYERCGDASGIAEALHNLGVIEHQTGDDAGAEQHYREAMHQFRQTGHVRGELICMLNLALLALKVDDFEAAEQYLDEAGPLAEKTGDAGMQGQHIGLRGTLAFRRGSFEQALDLFNKDLELKRRLGERFGTAEILDRIAEVTLKLGDAATARATAAESMRIALELDSHVLVIRCFETFAEIALITQDAPQARTCFEYARALRTEHAYRHAIRDLEALDAAIAGTTGGAAPLSPHGVNGWREQATTLAG